MKTLMVVAHPDNEIICGWPVLQDPEHEVSILCCSSDRYNEARKKWARRAEGLAALCSHFGIKSICLDNPSGFYKTNSRDGSLSNVIQGIVRAVMQFDFDQIYKHNFWGEYGHLDHQLVHNVIACNFHNVITSDMFIESNWTPYKNIRGRFASDANPVENDLEHYAKCKSFYDDIHCWTWNKEAVRSCSVHSL